MTLMTMAEQKKILMKEYKKGNISMAGVNSRLRFGRGVMAVIKALDDFTRFQGDQLEKYEKGELKRFREQLVMIRGE